MVNVIVLLDFLETNARVLCIVQLKFQFLVSKEKRCVTRSVDMGFVTMEIVSVIVALKENCAKKDILLKA